jgi:outer membrane protein
MKQVSIILNVVLLVLVGILFYWHFSSNASGSAQNKSGEIAVDIHRPMQIGYVNLDTLQEYYGYFKQKKAELESQQTAMENELNADAQELQKEANAFQKKAATMTQAEGEAEQKKLIQKQQELQQKQESMRQSLLQQQQQFQDELQSRLDSFLSKYNADKKYTYILSYASGASDILYKDTTNDITRAVLAGLNAAAKNGMNP